MKSDRELLIDWLNLFSVRTGEEFTLSSGQKSNVYIDVKKTALAKVATKLLAKLLCEKMLEEFSPVEAVAGVVLGGCHLASIVAMHHPLGIDTVYVRKEVKTHGALNIIDKPYVTYLQHVVIIEDVVTTGKSALNAARLLRDEGFDICGILAVVDRRADKKPYLGNEFSFSALVNFEELTP